MNSPELTPPQITEIAAAILRATEDGDKLAPEDLKLVEMAINGMLNPVGIERFKQLHENATKPEGYTVPYLFEVEHMTIDHDRVIRWKGIAVEHFDHGFWQQSGWREKMRADAESLAACCQQLEEEGIQPTVRAVLDRS